MRIHPLIAPLVLGLAVAVSPQARAQASPEADAQAVIAKALTAFHSRDYAAYEALLSSDVEAFTGVYTPLRFVGKAQWMAYIHGLDNFAASSYEQRDRACRAYNNDVVLCNSYFVFTTTTKAGVTAVQTGRESATLVKSGGKWLIANEHYSAMF